MLVSLAAAAQELRGQPSRMPESFTPPAGLCRLWIDGVPASQQPAPTDCASAIRNRTSNAAVVFGPQRRGESVDLRPFAGRSAQPPVRQLVPGARPARSRDEELRTDPRTDARTDPRTDARARAMDTTRKPLPRKPEIPQ